MEVTITRKVKVIIGIALIIISAGLMIFWEAYGRAMLLNEDILVSSTDIKAGEICKAENFSVISVSKGARIKNGITPDTVSKYYGRKYKHNINANSQVSSDSFVAEEDFEEGNGIFVIKSEWIMNISSSLRKGDRIKIYATDYSNADYLGSYYVAFVKDSGGREITELSGIDEPKILNRTSGIALPSMIEISGTLEDYLKVVRCVAGGRQLILEQEEVTVYE